MSQGDLHSANTAVFEPEDHAPVLTRHLEDDPCLYVDEQHQDAVIAASQPRKLGDHRSTTIDFFSADDATGRLIERHPVALDRSLHPGVEIRSGRETTEEAAFIEQDPFVRRAQLDPLSFLDEPPRVPIEYHSRRSLLDRAVEFHDPADGRRLR
jgi:hypothetical protein